MKIIDTSPLILFIDKINEKDNFYLLAENGENLKLPESVYNEFNVRSQDNTLDDFVTNDVFDLLMGMSKDKEETIKNNWQILGSGEINVFAWAEVFKSSGINFVCVLDDGPARNICKTMGFPLTGSIGLLKSLKKKGLLSQEKIVEIVGKIKASDFRIKDDILEDLLNA